MAEAFLVGLALQAREFALRDVNHDLYLVQDLLGSAQNQNLVGMGSIPPVLAPPPIIALRKYVHQSCEYRGLFCRSF
jgi:hypothetical protein